VETKTNDGSIDVFESVFPKDGFTNLKIPIPDAITFMPTPEIQEKIELSCSGTNIPMA